MASLAGMNAGLFGLVYYIFRTKEALGVLITMVSLSKEIFDLRKNIENKRCDLDTDYKNKTPTKLNYE